MNSTKSFAELEKQNGKKWADDFRKQMREYDAFIDAGGFVPSGNWCKCCERYDCGCIEAARVDRDRDAGRLP